MNKTIKTILGAVLTAALALSLAGCGAAAGTAKATETIAVTASASVMITPDKATVSFGVSTQETTAALAQSKNSETVAAVVAALRERGVEEKSIRTSYYNLYPMIDYSDDGEQRVIGYRVQTTLSVQDQDIEALGELLAACVDAGVNNVDSIRFFCSDYDKAYREALDKAVAASKIKAETLASAAGRKAGAVVSITEGWENNAARYSSSDMNMTYFAEAKAAAGPSFQPGETEITASVTVVYGLE